MYAFALERFQVDRQGRYQRFSFAGLHLGDLAPVQHHAADHLHVEVAHGQHAPARLAHHGEGLREQFVERGTLAEFLPELDRLLGQFLVGQLLDRGLKLVDGLDDGAHRLEFALVLSAEDFGDGGVKNHGAVPSLYCTGAGNPAAAADATRPAACASKYLWG